MRKIFTTFIIFLFAMYCNAQNQVSQATGTGGMLTVQVTPVGDGGGYFPNHSLSIWIEDASGKMVNTMMLYSHNVHNSGSDMSTWYNLIGSWTTRSTYMDVDATAGATLTSFGARTCYWGKTTDLSTFPDGTYTIGIEYAEGPANVNTIGHRYATFTFQKGTSAETLTPANQTYFRSVTITWEPVSTTAVNNVNAGDMYKVYPNPIMSNAYVTGYDIRRIDVYSLTGAFVFSSTSQNLDFSGLQKGIYFIKITSDSGAYFKKVEKL